MLLDSNGDLKNDCKIGIKVNDSYRQIERINKESFVIIRVNKNDNLNFEGGLSGYESIQIPKSHTKIT